MQEEKICLFPDQKQRASVIAESVPHERDRSSFCISCAGNPPQNRTEADHTVRFAMYMTVQDSDHERAMRLTPYFGRPNMHNIGAQHNSRTISHQYGACRRTKFGQALQQIPKSRLDLLCAALDP